MLGTQLLHGVYVPIITPFREDGSLDIVSFQTLARKLAAGGIHGLVVNGTTGESPVLSQTEIDLLTQEALAITDERQIPLVVGTGTNDTVATVKRTERAAKLGAQAALVVVPYYSRPSQEGILAHFREAAKVGLPIIAYEIPYRTGTALSMDTARTLLQMEGIIGLKDSSGALHLVSELARTETTPVLCGEDAYYYASLCCGAKGGILASANVQTEKFVDIYNLVRAGRFTEAKNTFDSLLPLLRLLFQEPNPAPLKWLLNRQGIIESGTLRLPLIPISRKLESLLEPFIT